MSQFLFRIEDALRQETGESRRAELLARRAGYLARVGDFDQARSIVMDLRRQFDDGRDGYVTVWIMIAEGLVRLYENVNSDAYDRIKRAQFISAKIMKVSELIAISSAWKAHLEFETSRFDEMFESLALTRDSATPRDVSALTRYSMVVCDVFNLCGDIEQSQKWFMRAREHALQDGDQASLEALVYNRAAFRLAWIRAQRCLGVFDRKFAEGVSAELASSMNFQALINISAHVKFAPLCQARSLVLLEKYSAAIERLQELRDSTSFAVYNFGKEFVDLEIAYCYAKQGNFAPAKVALRNLESFDFSRFDVDEQLVARWMTLDLIEMNRSLGSLDKAKKSFDEVVEIYSAQMSYLRQGIESYVI